MHYTRTIIATGITFISILILLISCSNTTTPVNKYSVYFAVTGTGSIAPYSVNKCYEFDENKTVTNISIFKVNYSAATIIIQIL